jgi:hypothetical protein
MILMAVVSMGLMFGMPKLMENSKSACRSGVESANESTDMIAVDPETKQEFEEMQKTGVLGSGTTNTASQIQNFDLASWMAGKTDSKAPSGRSQSPAAQPKKR